MGFGKNGKHSSIFVLVDLLYLIIAIYYWAILFFIVGDVDVKTLDSIVIVIVSYITILFIFCLYRGNLKRRFSLFSFNTAFFILLVGRYITHLGDPSSYGRFVFTTVSQISLFNEGKGLLLMLISLNMVSFGYKMNIRFTLGNTGIGKGGDYKNYNSDKLKLYTRITMIIGGAAAFTKLLGKVYYVARNGYLATYTNIGGAFYNNALIDMFDGFYLIGLYGYLACFPSKREVKRPIIVFMIYNILSLFTGVRGELVVGILFIVWYYFKREQVFPDEKNVFNKRRILLMGIFALFLANFLFDYGFKRVGRANVSGSFFSKLIMFISSQGGSGKLISLSLENEEAILQYISRPMILFAPLRNFLINNSLVRIFTGGAIGQNVNNLFRTGSLSGILTYITNPSSYLAGAGLGTCYISELVLSFGLFGVIVFNLVLGSLFQRIDNIQDERTWAQTTFLFRAFSLLVYIPRHSALQIIPECFVLFLYIFAMNKIT